MNQKRIGLLGGTFNPIHNGHLHIADAVFEHLHLDEVFFIPSGVPPHREIEGLLSARYRLEMVRLALLKKTSFSLCDLEVSRIGPSYSIDTIRMLKQQSPTARLFFIIGMDAFSQLASWKEVSRITTLCSFVLVSRPGTPFSKLPDIDPLRTADRKPFVELDCGKRDAYTLSVSKETSFYFLRISPSLISSSTIRARIASGENTRKNLPDLVESFIIQHGFYQKD